MEGNVYDLSEFDHPGGFVVMVEYFGCAKCALEAFEENEHSKLAQNNMKKLKIGVMEGSSNIQ